MYFLPSKYSHRIDFETLNILSASIACYSLDLKDKYLLQHVESFSKPPHRLEYVRTIKDIEYFLIIN